MSNRYWVRFCSPGHDARPVKVPVPCQWWCSGHGEDNSVICAIVRATSNEPWMALRTCCVCRKINYVAAAVLAGGR